MDNEKLLKFAGFVEVPNRWYWDIHGERKLKWCFPKDIIIDLGKPPNFYKDTNACIRYLLPRVDGLEGVLFWPTTEGYWWSMSVIDIPFEGDTLAEAIEKYVDWQSEDDK